MNFLKQYESSTSTIGESDGFVCFPFTVENNQVLFVSWLPWRARVALSVSGLLEVRNKADLDSR